MNNNRLFDFTIFILSTITSLIIILIIGLYTLKFLNGNQLTFWLAIATILLTIMIFMFSNKQTNDIQEVTTKTATLTTDSNDIMKEVKQIQSDISTHIIGQAKEFSELFEKVVMICRTASSHNMACKVAVPVISFGSANAKLTREADRTQGAMHNYMELQQIFHEMISNGRELEIIILNFLPQNNFIPLFRYFETLKQSGIPGHHITNMEDNLNSFFNSLKEIINEFLKNIGKQKFKLYLVNEVLVDVVLAEDQDNPKSLLFFLGDKLLDFALAGKSITERVNAINELCISLYSQTKSVEVIADGLFRTQRCTPYTIDLFKNYDPLDIQYHINQVCKMLVYHGQSEENLLISIKNELKKVQSRKYEWYRLSVANNSSAQLYSWYTDSRSSAKNILFIPSAAGLHSLYHNRKTDLRNNYRFNIYNDLCEGLSRKFNVHLISLSGQANNRRYNNTEIGFSFDQSVNDILQIIEYLKGKGYSIDGALGICTGAVEFAEAMLKGNPGAPIPLICWDVPDQVHWEINHNWFARNFPDILIDEKRFGNGKEAISIIPKYQGPILYSFNSDNSQYQRSQFQNIVDSFTNRADVIIKEFTGIGHIPMKFQDADQYEKFMNFIIEWLEVNTSK